MAGAEIIGAAVGVLLLILVGYFLIGSALTTADIITTAQKDITLQTEVRLQTSIEINSISSWDPRTTFILKNTGQEPISDFSHMDVVLYSTGIPPTLYSNGNGGWSHGSPTGTLRPNILDPEEKMEITVYNDGTTTPEYIQVICANGVYTYKKN